MVWTDIIVALISFVGACVGTIYGIHKSNNLTVYRIEQLEKKMDAHNNIQNRVAIMETSCSDIKTSISNNATAIGKLTNNVTALTEQIDALYDITEKNEERILHIEKLYIQN